MLKLLCRKLLAGISIALAAPLLTAQDLWSAAAQLAAKISGRSAPGAVSVIIVNRSSFANDAIPILRSDLLRELQARGWRAKGAEGGGTSINLTLSENFRNYVWTAEILEGDSRKLAILELPRPKSSATARGEPVVLARTLLLSSDEPLLDVALIEGRIGEGTHLLALTPAAIELYQSQSSQWRLTETVKLGLDGRGSRDLRGRLVVQQGSIFDAYLPAMHCNGVVTQTLSFTCRNSDDPWPVNEDRRVLAFYAVSRNYFTGVLSGAGAQNGNTEPFYSAAVLADRAIYSGVDGQLRLGSTGQGSSVLAAKLGSSITAVEGACMPDLVLGSGTGDFDQPDSITAYAGSSAELRAASPPVPFQGAVIGLNATPDHQQAIAVIESSFGSYEAYLLSPRCGP